MANAYDELLTGKEAANGGGNEYDKLLAGGSTNDYDKLVGYKQEPGILSKFGAALKKGIVKTVAGEPGQPEPPMDEATAYEAMQRAVPKIRGVPQMSKLSKYLSEKIEQTKNILTPSETHPVARNLLTAAMFPAEILASLPGLPESFAEAPVETALGFTPYPYARDIVKGLSEGRGMEELKSGKTLQNVLAGGLSILGARHAYMKARYPYLEDRLVKAGFKDTNDAMESITKNPDDPRLDKLAERDQQSLVDTEDKFLEMKKQQAEETQRVADERAYRQALEPKAAGAALSGPPTPEILSFPKPDIMSGPEGPAGFSMRIKPSQVVKAQSLIGKGKPKPAAEAGMENKPSKAGFSVVEEAAADTKLITQEMLRDLKAGDDGKVTYASNTDAYNAFFNRLPKEELARMETSTGGLTQAAEARFNNAILAKVLKDKDTLSLILENTDPNIQRAVGIVRKAAPDILNLETHLLDPLKSEAGSTGIFGRESGAQRIARLRKAAEEKRSQGVVNKAREEAAGKPAIIMTEIEARMLKTDQYRTPNYDQAAVLAKDPTGKFDAFENAQAKARSSAPAGEGEAPVLDPVGEVAMSVKQTPEETPGPWEAMHEARLAGKGKSFIQTHFMNSREILGDDVVNKVVDMKYGFIPKETARIKALEWNIGEGKKASIDSIEQDYKKLPKKDRLTFYENVAHALDGDKKFADLKLEAEQRAYLVYRQAWKWCAEEFGVDKQTRLLDYFFHTWKEMLQEAKTAGVGEEGGELYWKAKEHIADFEKYRAGAQGYRVDVPVVFDIWMRKAMQKKYLEPTLVQTQDILNKKNLSSVGKKYEKLWLRKAAGKDIGFEKIAREAHIAPSIMGHKLFDVSLKDAIDRYTLATYRQLLGGALDTASVNMTQPLFNRIPEIPLAQLAPNIAKTAAYMARDLTRAARDVVTGSKTSEILQNPKIMRSFSEYIAMNDEIIGKRLPKVMEIMCSAPMQFTEYLNRGFSFYSGFLEKMHDLNKTSPGMPEAQKILQAQSYGVDVAGRTQFRIGALEDNIFLSQLPKNILMFTKYPVNQASLIRRWVTTGQKSALIKFALLSGVLIALGYGQKDKKGVIGNMAQSADQLNTLLSFSAERVPFKEMYDVNKKWWRFKKSLKLGDFIDWSASASAVASKYITGIAVMNPEADITELLRHPTWKNVKKTQPFRYFQK